MHVTSLRDTIIRIRVLSSVPRPFIASFNFFAKNIGLHLMFQTRREDNLTIFYELESL